MDGAARFRGREASVFTDCKVREGGAVADIGRLSFVRVVSQC